MICQISLKDPTQCVSMPGLKRGYNQATDQKSPLSPPPSRSPLYTKKCSLVMKHKLVHLPVKSLKEQQEAWHGMARYFDNEYLTARSATFKQPSCKIMWFLPFPKINKVTHGPCHILTMNKGWEKELSHKGRVVRNLRRHKRESRQEPTRGPYKNGHHGEAGGVGWDHHSTYNSCDQKDASVDFPLKETQHLPKH